MAIDDNYTEDTDLSDIYECLLNGTKCPACSSNATGLCMSVTDTSAFMRCILAVCQPEWIEPQ